MSQCILFLGIALFAFSCNSGDKSNKVADGEKFHTDTLRYRMEHFKDFSPYFSATETQIDSTIFSASFPIFNNAIDTLVKKALFIDGEDNIKQVSDSFLAGFNEYAEEQVEIDESALQTWFKQQECNVVYNIPGLLTLHQHMSNYTGGAHSQELDLWFNYDTEDKKQLELTDIVQDTSKLRTIVENHFRKQEALSDTASLEGRYFFHNNTFALADNFGLTEKGLLFHYNPYDIKPYAAGSTTVIVPYSELQDLLTEKVRHIQAGTPANKNQPN